jgi:hypothetical protein
MLAELAALGIAAAVGSAIIRREKRLSRALAVVEARNHHERHHLTEHELVTLIHGLWKASERWRGPDWHAGASDATFCAASHLSEMDPAARERVLMRAITDHHLPLERFMRWRSEYLRPEAVCAKRHRGLDSSELRRRIDELQERRP